MKTLLRGVWQSVAVFIVAIVAALACSILKCTKDDK